MNKVKIRSESHRRFVASLPCCLCGREDVQAAHIRAGNGGGMGMKPGDDCCVPLCIRCHDGQHRIGEKMFWGDSLNAAKALANKLFSYNKMPPTPRRAYALEAIRYFKNSWRTM